MVENACLETTAMQNISPAYTREVWKLKDSKMRTYDADGYTSRAGCLCFKSDQEQEVLLISSNRFPDKWIVPAGGVEWGETANQAAVREVLEEAGVKGHLGRCIGVFQNELSKNRTTIFTLIVTEEMEKWEDYKNGRRRSWFTMTEAKQLLDTQTNTTNVYWTSREYQKENSEDTDFVLTQTDRY